MEVDVSTLTVRDLAREMKMPLSSTYRWLKAAGVPTIKVSARCTRIPRAALAAWLRNGGRSPEAGEVPTSEPAPVPPAPRPTGPVPGGVMLQAFDRPWEIRG